jgi:hypothetical protein
MFQTHFPKIQHLETPKSDAQSEYVVIKPNKEPLRIADSKDPQVKYETKTSLSHGSPAIGGMKGEAVGHAVSLPPQINNTLTVNSRIRYLAGADNIVSVSAIDLIGAFGGVCTVTNSVFKPWASSCRIKKLIAWPSCSTTSQNSCSLWWNSGIAGANRDLEKSSDVPTGVTNTRAVSFVPPAKSLAEDWIAASVGTTNIFSLLMNIGSVVDVHCEFTLSNQFTSGTVSLTTGVLGSIYYLPLDGPSSHTYFPIHLPTTF